MTRVLLTSIFGPYARDDLDGSRAINPMELYHHQVTREQGAFSFRTFHRSWGLMMIQANIEADCMLLDYPSQQRFVEELRNERYDVIGISGISTNLMKVRKMCRLIRKHQPDAKTVIGGHIANIQGLERLLHADHIVRGEGVSWMRKFLGEDPDRPLRHPRVITNIGSRIMGVSLRDNPADLAATLIPGVGCPMGCNFCSTSAMFGGKGKAFSYFRSAEEIYGVMCDLEESLGVQSFFVMDENFLFDRKRALALLELMQSGNKPWSLLVFSSANVLEKFSMEELVALGISWVWIGLEGEHASFAKLKRADTRQLVRNLQAHGIRVLGSSIIGLPEHTSEGMEKVIEHAVSHSTEFHQFMLYTPVPGTPLYEEHREAGTLLDLAEINVSDIHGQGQLSFRHPHIEKGDSARFLQQAFERDFEVNGPSIVRIARTTLRAWRRFRNHPDERVRARFAYEAQNIALRYPAMVWAARAWLQDSEHLRELTTELLEEFYSELGMRARLLVPIAGRYLLRKVRQEDKRLREGWTYEPPTFYESQAEAA